MSEKIQVIDSNLIKKNGDKYSVTDANGKVFEVGLNDIIDTSTDLGSNIGIMEDGYSEKMLNFSPSITDSEGETITDSELLDAVKSGKAIALDVLFEATHSGENLNNAVYTSNSLEEDSKSWMYPFAKPLIKNHDMWEEPIGRATDYLFGKSEFCEDRDAIDVTYRVSDEDAMIKFADGRYKTMSIGATCGHIRCNVCGKDILKDSKFKFCGHWKGETYAGKKATWTVENMTYREGSIVNAPADVYAQVKSIKVINKREDKPMSKNNDHANDDAVFDSMDGLLNNGQQADPPKDPDNTNNPKGEGANGNVGNDNDDAKGNEPQVDLQSQLDAANEKIADLEGKVTTLTSDKEEAENKLTEANENLEVVNTDNAALKDEVSKFKDQATRMAKFNLKLMKDTLMELNPELSDAELEGKTSRQINDMINEIKEKAQTRHTSKVKTPGLAVKDKNTDVNDDDEDDNNKDQKVYTMKDMEKVLQKVWDKH